MTMPTREERRSSGVILSMRILIGPVLPVNATLWDQMDRIRKGMPMTGFDRFVEATGWSPQVVCHHIGLAVRTLARRRKEKVLQPYESERLLRMARTIAYAAERIGLERAQEWVAMPHRDLKGKTPLSILDVDIGAQWVERMTLEIPFPSLVSLA